MDGKKHLDCFVDSTFLSDLTSNNTVLGYLGKKTQNKFQNCLNYVRAIQNFFND